VAALLSWLLNYIYFSKNLNSRQVGFQMLFSAETGLLITGPFEFQPCELDYNRFWTVLSPFNYWPGIRKENPRCHRTGLNHSKHGWKLNGCTGHSITYSSIQVPDTEMSRFQMFPVFRSLECGSHCIYILRSAPVDRSKSPWAWILAETDVSLIHTLLNLNFLSIVKIRQAIHARSEYF
jgi:hypothetical protein